MKKIYDSIRKRPVNLVLLLCVVVLYLLNNHYFKAHFTGSVRYFFICYFNDLMCPLAFFSYANLLLLTVDRELSSFWAICTVGICASLVWEFLAPLMKSSSTTDPKDLVYYMAGSMVYWMILHFVKKKED